MPKQVASLGRCVFLFGIDDGHDVEIRDFRDRALAPCGHERLADIPLDFLALAFAWQFVAKPILSHDGECRCLLADGLLPLPLLSHSGIESLLD